MLVLFHALSPQFPFCPPRFYSCIRHFQNTFIQVGHLCVHMAVHPTPWFPRKHPGCMSNNGHPPPPSAQFGAVFMHVGFGDGLLWVRRRAPWTQYILQHFECTVINGISYAFQWPTMPGVSRTSLLCQTYGGDRQLACSCLEDSGNFIGSKFTCCYRKSKKKLPEFKVCGVICYTKQPLHSSPLALDLTLGLALSYDDHRSRRTFPKVGPACFEFVLQHGNLHQMSMHVGQPTPSAVHPGPLFTEATTYLPTPMLAGSVSCSVRAAPEMFSGYGDCPFEWHGHFQPDTAHSSRIHSNP